MCVWYTLCTVLAHIFNVSMSTSVFPKLWKTAVVCPLYKEGDRESSNNYRPISLLPLCSKLLERLVHDRIYRHLRLTNFLTDAQSGFRKGHSTTTCLIDFLDVIFKEIDVGKVCGVLFLDLKKAFDSVNHTLLLNKLCGTGVDSSVVDWVRSYLSGRHQVSRVGGVSSGALPIKFGVPQGSILGPLLFVIFVNDLPGSMLDCGVHLYADDTAITVSSAGSLDLQDKLNNKLRDAAEWMNRNQLVLNNKKTKVMYFGTRQSLSKCNDITVTLNDETIECVEEFKYLGVVLDRCLRFDSHVQYVKNKCIGRIKMLGKLRPVVGLEVALSLYKSLVSPLLDYGDVVYDCLSAKSSAELQKMQNYAFRVILQAGRSTHVADMHRELNMIYLTDRRHIHTINQTYKCVYKLAPERLHSQIQMISHNHNMTTRSITQNQLQIPHCNLEMTKRAFRHRAPALWAMVDEDLRQRPSYESFKRALLQSDMFEVVG